ncbi:type IV pilus assembly protein FimV [Acinetobacter indicus]|uniref:type IV pilus assembly protein FimV n=1 Tax=Acinetobacter indicus TaxID=756892 RepID=UPI0032B4FFF9
MTELTIKMTVYNKLKIAILAILASQHIHAINVDPVQIQSAPGELLYAEMNFRQSNVNAPIEVSLASAEDLIAIGASHRPPGHLNFFTRRDGAGNGVITITSSRPLTDTELNIVVKIREGSATRLQHIKTSLKRSTLAEQRAQLQPKEQPLTPVMVVNERDIALNLPTSTAYTAATASASTTRSVEAPLAIQASPPPALSPSATATVSAAAQPAASPVSAATPSTSATSAQPAFTNNASKTAAVNTAAPVSADPLVKKYAEQLKAQQQQAPAKPAPVTVPKAPAPSAPASTTARHVVQSNESLWAIASRIAAENQQPVGEVMQQIKAHNEHAFIQGDANRLRRGATLNLQAVSSGQKAAKKTVPIPATQPSRQSGKAKYRISQAEMSLVAENQQDSAQGSAKKNTQSAQTSEELSLKVMTAREKTVKLQRNVTQLELALSQKDQRIQLLNARLAELQQQLKKQQAENKPKL